MDSRFVHVKHKMLEVTIRVACPYACALLWLDCLHVICHVTRSVRPSFIPRVGYTHR